MLDFLKTFFTTTFYHKLAKKTRQQIHMPVRVFRAYYWLFAIVLVATALRILHLSQVSLWHDEAFSALMIRYPWREMFYHLSLDVHPPLYYVFLKIWSIVFGSGIWSLRGFSVLFSSASVVGVFFLSQEIFGGTFHGRPAKIALWSALLFAINPFQLRYANEARMYQMGIFFSVLAAYFLIIALRRQQEYFSLTDQTGNFARKGAKRTYGYYYCLFILCAGISDLTHYYLLFITTALCLYALVFHMLRYGKDLRKYRAITSSLLLIGLAFVPWLRQFLFQLSRVQSDYWIKNIDGWSVAATFWDLLIGFGQDPLKTASHITLVIITLVCIFILFQFIKKTIKAEKWLLVFCMLAPFFGALIFATITRLKGTNTSVYIDRYFLFSGTFFAIILAGWFSTLPKKFGAAALAAYCFISIVSYSHYWSLLALSEKPGMKGAAKFLGENVEPGQRVFSAAAYEFFNYKYYVFNYYPLPGGITPKLLVSGQTDISTISHITGSALLSNDQITPSLTQGVKPGDTVWVLWTMAFEEVKPSTPANWTQVDEQQFADILPNTDTVIYVTEYKVNE